MRNWTYSYKTSDGVRHEGTLSAPSKDMAFAALREKGIRPIRVDELAPPTPRRLGALTYRQWLILAVLVLLLSIAVAGMVVFILPRRGVHPVLAAPPTPQNTGKRSPAFQKIVEEVEEARDKYREGMEKVDYELLANYALVERIGDMAEFHSMIAYGREVVSNARESVTRSLRAYYEGIPETAVRDRNDAQRLYGLVMSELDAAEEGLDGDDCVLTLLDMNRGQWHVARGSVVWKDARLERQFRLLGRDLGAGKTKWEWDSGREESKAIESNVVGLPPSGSWSVPAVKGPPRKPKSR